MKYERNAIVVFEESDIIISGESKVIRDNNQITQSNNDIDGLNQHENTVDSNDNFIQNSNVCINSTPENLHFLSTLQAFKQDTLCQNTHVIFTSTRNVPEVTISLNINSLLREVEAIQNNMNMLLCNVDIFSFTRNQIERAVYNLHPEQQNNFISMLLDNMNRQIYTASDLSKARENIILIIAEITRLTEVKTVDILSRLMNFNVNFMFKTIKSSKNKIIAPEVRLAGYGNIGYRLHYAANQFISKNRLMYKRNVIKEMSYFGEIIGCYIQYSDDSGKESMWVLGHDVGNDGQVVGLAPVEAHCMSYGLIHAHSEQTVVLFASSEDALNWQVIAREANLCGRSRYIVTGFFDAGGAELVDFSELFDRDVVVVASPDDANLEELKKLLSRIEKGQPRSVSVFPWLVTASPVEEAYHGNSIMHERAQVSLVYGDAERPSLLLEKVVEKALELEAYRSWRNGLRSEQCGEETSEKYVFKKLDSIVPEADKGGLRAWEDIVKPGTYVHLWGPTNSGKSHVACELALGFAQGSGVLGLPCRGAGVKVAYVDGEMSDAEFQDVCGRLGAKPDIDLFHVEAGADFIEDCGDFIKGVLEQKIKLVVIDNLASLAHKATRGQSNGLMNFMNEMKNHHVAVILVNHTGKDGKDPLGAADISNLCRASIRIDGNKSLEDAKGNLPRNVQECLDEYKIVIRLQFEKLKFGAWLPVITFLYNEEEKSFEIIDGSWDMPSSVGEDVKEIDDDNRKCGTNIATDEPISDINKTLSPDEMEIYEALKEKNYSRSGLEEKTGKGPDTIRNLLNGLIDKELVYKHGNGKQTYYSTNQPKDNS